MYVRRETDRNAGGGKMAGEQYAESTRGGEIGLRNVKWPSRLSIFSTRNNVRKRVDRFCKKRNIVKMKCKMRRRSANTLTCTDFDIRIDILFEIEEE